MTADKLFSECFVLCDIIYVGCQYLSSCNIFEETIYRLLLRKSWFWLVFNLFDQINKTEKFKKQTIVYRKTILHYIIMKWVEHQNIMSILFPGKIFHFIIFVVKSFKSNLQFLIFNLQGVLKIVRSLQGLRKSWFWLVFNLFDQINKTEKFKNKPLFTGKLFCTTLLWNGSNTNIL